MDHKPAWRSVRGCPAPSSWFSAGHPWSREGPSQVAQVGWHYLLWRPSRCTGSNLRMCPARCRHPVLRRRSLIAIPAPGLERLSDGGTIRVAGNESPALTAVRPGQRATHARITGLKLRITPLAIRRGRRGTAADHGASGSVITAETAEMPVGSPTATGRGRSKFRLVP